jgi:hypothetical protein
MMGEAAYPLPPERPAYVWGFIQNGMLSNGITSLCTRSASSFTF